MRRNGAPPSAAYCRSVKGLELGASLGSVFTGAPSPVCTLHRLSHRRPSPGYYSPSSRQSFGSPRLLEVVNLKEPGRGDDHRPLKRPRRIWGTMESLLFYVEDYNMRPPMAQRAVRDSVTGRMIVAAVLPLQRLCYRARRCSSLGQTSPPAPQASSFDHRSRLPFRSRSEPWPASSLDTFVVCPPWTK